MTLTAFQESEPLPAFTRRSLVSQPEPKGLVTTTDWYSPCRGSLAVYREEDVTSEASEFSLPNVAVGPNPFTLSALSEDVSFVVLFFQCDYHCANCREQAQQLADRIDEFREHDAEVVSIVPESVERVKQWQESYDLPYPLLADPNTEAGDAYDQPVRLGLLGRYPISSAGCQRGHHP
jgi:peroxiredoxin